MRHFATGYALSCLFPLILSLPTFADELADGFRTPPSDTSLGCYWYFLKDDVTKEGITKDLEAMARVGIRRAQIGYIAQGENPPGDNRVFSDKWWDRLAHTFKEGDRLGVEIGLFNCPGWSQSGGPWITPERSMRNLVNTEVTVAGPSKFDAVLPGREGYFETVKVLAFRRPPQEKVNPYPEGTKITCDGKSVSTFVDGKLIHTMPMSDIACSPDALFDNNAATTFTFPTVPGNAPYTLTFQFEKPFAVQSIIAKPEAGRTGFFGVLEASDDGTHYRKVCDVAMYHGHQGVKITDPIAAAVPTTKARYFRLVLTRFGEARTFSSLELSPRAMLDEYVIKQLGTIHHTPHPLYGTYVWNTQDEPKLADSVLPTTDVVDLTDRTDADGRLKWDVPEGDWVIARFGMVSTGSKNAPAMPDATGLECDKMSAEHIRYHFDQYVGDVLRRIPAKDRKSFRYIIQDSYETGPQNWTDDMLARFRKRFGYDPTPWLPVTTGRIVGSADQSERFLWDLRRLVADLIATEYVGALTQAAEKNGLKGWLENYGHWGFPSEILLYGKHSTEIGGEFWLGNNLGTIECRPPASCAHIYGKKEVWAEAFTAGIRYVQTPRSHLKHYGDWAFCEGINRFILHLYIHQPRDEKPGVDAWFGTNFTRNNSWFNLLPGYFDYCRRVTHLMRQGTSVADVCYYIGEGAPKMDGPREPRLPRGYDFDFVNADVILNRMQVKNGRLCIPAGPSYKVMVLPDVKTMRPEIAAKILEFAKGGVVISGPRPVHSPSLENYPACDEKLATLVKQIWDSKLVTEDRDLRRILTDAGVTPDFAYRLPDPELQAKEDPYTDLSYANLPQKNSLRFAHRKVGDTDIYFVANMQTDRAFDAECTFRVGSKAPEIWNPVTGEIRNASAFTRTKEGVRLPMHFEPQESWFFVFRTPAESDGKGESNVLRTQVVKKLDGPWTVRFDPKWGGPEKAKFPELVSWTKRKEDAIRFYSGEAVYAREFEIDTLPKGRVWLDLGDVADLAEVTLNGKTLGIVWTQPWRIEITDALKKGTNRLQVKVANTWNNRLYGDRKAKDRVTKNYTPYNAGKLLPAGLLGPVAVEVETGR